LSAAHTPGQLQGSEAGSSLTVFEFSRDDKKTFVSTADMTETLRKLKERCCREPDDKVFRLSTVDLDALVGKSKRKFMKVNIGPGVLWKQSYESCKGLTVAQIMKGLGTEERRQLPIQLKFTIVDIEQMKSTEGVYYSDSGEDS
jgi:hypothetical protein